MGERIAFENGQISEFWGLVTLTLDRVILSCITRRPLPTWRIYWKSKKVFVDGRMDRYLRPALLGGLGEVDLKMTDHHNVGDES